MVAQITAASCACINFIPWSLNKTDMAKFYFLPVFKQKSVLHIINELEVE